MLGSTRPGQKSERQKAVMTRQGACGLAACKIEQCSVFSAPGCRVAPGRSKTSGRAAGAQSLPVLKHGHPQDWRWGREEYPEWWPALSWGIQPLLQAPVWPLSPWKFLQRRWERALRLVWAPGHTHPRLWPPSALCPGGMAGSPEAAGGQRGPRVLAELFVVP